MNGDGSLDFLRLHDLNGNGGLNSALFRQLDSALAAADCGLIMMGSLAPVAVVELVKLVQRWCKRKWEKKVQSYLVRF